MMVDNDIE